MSSATGYGLASLALAVSATWASWRAFGPRSAVVGYAVPALLALAMRFELASIVVPAAGPWAGESFGHHGCTMATQFPLASRVGLGVGVALLATLVVRPRSPVARFFVAPWWIVWAIAGLLSEANTLS